jgi:hypothetical protein
VRWCSSLLHQNELPGLSGLVEPKFQRAVEGAATRTENGAEHGLSSFLGLFSAHLVLYNSVEQALASGLQHAFGIETPEQIKEGSDQAGPARLVAGPAPRAVVTVARFTGRWYF